MIKPDLICSLLRLLKIAKADIFVSKIQQIIQSSLTKENVFEFIVHLEKNDFQSELGTSKYN